MIIADIEASGLNPQHSSIMSIGALDFDNPEYQFYGECRVWDGAKIDPESLEVNGFTEADAVDPTKPTLSELMHQFHEWIQPISDKTLMGQNVSFDRDYLNDSFYRSEINWRFSHRTIDLHSIGYFYHLQKDHKIPQKNEHSGLNLNTLLNFVGVPREPDPHNGLMGAKCEAEVLSRILYGKNLLPEFAEFPVPDHFAQGSLLA